MQRQILKQMQKMQKKMQASMSRIQEELEEAVIEGSAGGGAVKVTVNGHQQVQSVKIAPEAVDPEDVETLEDLVLCAVRDALDRARELSMEKMGALTQGLNLPPGLF